MPSRSTPPTSWRAATRWPRRSASTPSCPRWRCCSTRRAPSSIANTALALAGTIEVVPPLAPLTLLVWGVKRVLPVRLTQFWITEQAYDPGLNPIRAQVALGLRVLSYSDLPMTNPGYHMFLAHQITKEVLATIGSASAIATAGPGFVGSLPLGA